MWGIGIGLINGLVFGIKHESFNRDEKMSEDEYQLSWRITISVLMFEFYILTFS